MSPGTDTKPHRPIRSFVLRQGRMTEGQLRAYTTLWPRYGLELDTTFNFPSAFGNSNPVFLEIGFGNGDALAQMAATHPDYNYLGVEVHSPGVGHLMLQLAAQHSHNVRILQTDAMELLRHHLPSGSLSGIFLLFPDPWPKKKHHKRRIVQAEFARLAYQSLKPQGFLHMATDWEDYARQMMNVLSQTEGFINKAGAGQFSPRPAHRTLTKFERRGQRLGHGVWDLIFIRDT